MSRSKRKRPIRAITTAETEKQDKRDANRKFRRIVKQRVKRFDENIPQLREISNDWSFGKNGKIYDSAMTPKEMTK